MISFHLKIYFPKIYYIDFEVYYAKNVYNLQL